MEIYDFEEDKQQLVGWGTSKTPKYIGLMEWKIDTIWRESESGERILVYYLMGMYSW